MYLVASKPAVRRISKKRAFAWRGGAAARCLAGIAVVGASSLLLGQSAQATTYLYGGGTTGLWSNPLVWSPNGVPGSADTASFAGSAAQTVFLNGNQAALNLSLTATANTTSIRASVAGQVLSLYNGIQYGSTQTDLGASGTAALVVALMGSQSWTGTGSSLIQVDNGVTPATQAITNGTAAPVTLTFDGAGTGGKNIFGVVNDGSLGGTTALVMNATGTNFGALGLYGNNTYSGGTTFTQGYGLSLNNNTALGTGALTINGAALSGSVLRPINSGLLGGVVMTNNNAQNWNADFTLNGSQNIDFGTGAVAIGDITVPLTVLGVPLTGNRNIILGSTSNPVTFTEGGIISGTGYGLTLSATLNAAAVTTSSNLAIDSQLILNGANTYDGGTNIIGGLLRFGVGAVPVSGTIVLNGGALAVGTGTAFPTVASTSTVTRTAGSLALTGDSSENVSFAAVSGNISLGAALGSVVRYTGTLTPNNNSYNVGGGGGTLVLTNNNALTGNRTLALNGASYNNNGGGGTVIITGQNNFTGSVSLGAGTLQVSSLNKVVGGTATSNLGAPTTAANGTINLGATNIFNELRYVGQGETTDRTLNFNSFSGSATALDASGSGAVTFGGAFTTNSNSTNRFITIRGINTDANTITAGIGTQALNPGGINLTKQQRGNWTFTGTNNFAGTNVASSGITINGGSLTADYTTNPNILGATATNLTLGGGTLVMVNNGASAATQTLGAASLTSGTGQSSISVSGNGTAGSAALTIGNTLTRNPNTFLNFNLVNGGRVTSTLGQTNGVVVGTGSSATQPAFTVTDAAGMDFAAIVGGQVARLNASTPLPASGSANTTNYTLTGSQTLTATDPINTLRIDTSTGGGTLDVSTFNLTSAFAGVPILKDGVNAYTIMGTSIGASGASVVFTANGAGALTVSGAVTTGSGSLTKTGSGLVDLTGAQAFTGSTSIFGGVLRLSNAVNSGGNITLNTGGILEIGNDLNGATAGDFSRQVGTGGGQIQWTNGDGGFSAAGTDRVVNLTNNLGVAGGQLVWGSTNGTNNVTSPNASPAFVKDGFALLLSSSTATGMVTVQNPIDLVNLPRTIQVGDGTSAVDATLSGTLSSSDYSGGIYKTGAGTLAVTGTNTFTGGTTVSAGTVSGPTVGYSTGNVTVNAGATADYTQNTTTTYGASIVGNGSVTIGANPGGGVSGNGTITYTGVDSAAGGTSVKSGTLTLNHTGGGALTGPVSVATGGTVGLGSDNQIAPSSNVTLAGGTLGAGGFNEGTAATPGLGTLQVGNPTGAATDSTLDFGDAAGTAANTLAFSDSSTLAWNGTVTLTNYTDGTDALYIGTTNDLTATQLADIKFGSFIAGQDTSGKITFAPAPEPSGWASMIIGMGVLGGIISRKRRSSAAQAA